VYQGDTENLSIYSIDMSIYSTSGSASEGPFVQEISDVEFLDIMTSEAERALQEMRSYQERSNGMEPRVGADWKRNLPDIWHPSG